MKASFERTLNYEKHRLFKIPQILPDNYFLTNLKPLHVQKLILRVYIGHQIIEIQIEASRLPLQSYFLFCLKLGTISDQN